MRITYQCTINEEDTLTRCAPQWGPKEKGPIWNEGIFSPCFCIFHVKITAFQTGPKETWHWHGKEWTGGREKWDISFAWLWPLAVQREWHVEFYHNGYANFLYSKKTMPIWRGRSNQLWCNAQLKLHNGSRKLY